MNNKELLIDFIEYAKSRHVMPILHSNIEPLVDDYLSSKNNSKPIVISSALSGITCTARNCNHPAVGDYNGHGDYACRYHMDKWNDEFDDEYR